MNNSGCPKSFRYSNPQFGGQMGGITIKFMKNYDLFAAFVESIFLCALILKQSHPNVVPIAVADQHALCMKSWKLCNLLFQTTH